MAYVTNSTIQRRTPLKSKTRSRSQKQMKRSAIKRSTRPMKKAGKKSRTWMAVRRRLKIQHEAQEITTCELRYEGCTKDNMLGFAHGRKRRHLKGDELETLTILTCNNCHDQIEYLGPERMLAIVQSVIQKRQFVSG